MQFAAYAHRRTHYPGASGKSNAQSGDADQQQETNNVPMAAVLGNPDDGLWTPACIMVKPDKRLSNHPFPTTPHPSSIQRLSGVASLCGRISAKALT
jgi:hypothetical protein